MLVWFHGGSFVIGASSQAVYDGARLAAEENVVVVSVNYRLGALGFLDTRTVGGVANCGRARRALRARSGSSDHIELFGGDPTRVVPFGESAGGGLLLHALAAPAARSLVAGAIVQSGATFATLDDDQAAVVAETLVKEAGVDDLDALRTLPVEELIAAQGRAMGALLSTVGMMPFHPMVDGDVVPCRPAAGARVRGTAVTGHDGRRDGACSSTATRPRRRVTASYAEWPGTSTATRRPRSGSSTRTPRRSAPTTLPQSGSGSSATTRCRCRHGPCWTRIRVAFTYCFTWEGPGVGACHGIDIPFTFGNFVEGWDAFVGLDADGETLSQFIRHAWAEFARRGEPGWSAYPAAMLLGREQRAAPSHPLFARALAS